MHFVYDMGVIYALFSIFFTVDIIALKFITTIQTVIINVQRCFIGASKITITLITPSNAVFVRHFIPLNLNGT